MPAPGLRKRSTDAVDLCLSAKPANVWRFAHSPFQDHTRETRYR